LNNLGALAPLAALRLLRNRTRLRSSARLARCAAGLRPCSTYSGLGTLVAPALVLLVLGCSQRERLNPFDPGNPRTRGRPAGFSAVAGDAVVSLQWQPSVANGLLGYQVFRRVAGETEFQPISALLSRAANGYLDAGLANGVDHHYQLYFVFAEGPVGPPSEDVATPGKLRAWVADYRAANVKRITPDGRDVAYTDPTFGGPTQLAVDPSNGNVWICDNYGQEVIVYVTGFPAPTPIRGIPDPVAVAVDPVDQTGWICDPSNQRVLHFTASGTALPPKIQVSLLDPTAVAVDPRDRALWLCENRGDVVRKITLEGAPLWSVPVTRPSRVATDSLTGAAWVTSLSQGQVHLITSQGVIFDTYGGFLSPNGIAVDTQRRRIWVAELGGDRVTALRQDGSVEFRVGGLIEPQEIAVDRNSGNAWVTLPGAGAVAVISPTGQIRSRLTGFSQPWGIALDPGR
jgi:DNA-binding beta-propeller fold protein YncE